MSLVKFSTSSENISSNGGFSFVSGILDAVPAMLRHANTLILKVSRCFSYLAALRRVEAIC